MTTTTIGALPTSGAITGTEQIPLDQGLSTVKITPAALATYTIGQISSSGQTITATVINQTGTHGQLETLNLPAGQIALYSDYSGIVAGNGTTTASSVYMPNGIQIVKNTGAPSTTITVTYITGGLLSVTSVNVDDSINIVMPNGLYDKQVIVLRNDIAYGTTGGSINTVAGTNMTVTLLATSGFAIPLIWIATNGKWAAQKMPELVYFPNASTEIHSGSTLALGFNAKPSYLGNDIVIGANALAGGTTTGNCIILGSNTSGNTSGGTGSAISIGNTSSVLLNGISIGGSSTAGGYSSTAVGDGATTYNNYSSVFFQSAAESGAINGATITNFCLFGSTTATTAKELSLTGAAAVGTTPLTPATADTRFYLSYDATGNASSVPVIYEVTLSITATNAAAANYARFQRKCLFLWSGTTLSLLGTPTVVGTDVWSAGYTTLLCTPNVVTPGTTPGVNITAGANGQISLSVNSINTTATKYVAYGTILVVS